MHVNQNDQRQTVRRPNPHRAAQLLIITSLAATLLAGCGTASQPAKEVVSEADYRAGVEAAARCMERGGFEVGELELEPNGWRWSFSIGGLKAGASRSEQAAFDDRMDAVYDECMKEHVGGLENAYRRSRVPTADRRPAIMEQFLECARKAGLDTLEASDTQEMIATKLSRAADNMVGSVNICLDQFEGLWPESIPE